VIDGGAPLPFSCLTVDASKATIAKNFAIEGEANS
jgi:hypothetical protein